LTKYTSETKSQTCMRAIFGSFRATLDNMQDVYMTFQHLYLISRLFHA